MGLTQAEERTISLMRKLYGLWDGLPLDEPVHYEVGDFYAPHLLRARGQDLPRQSLRAFLHREWVWTVNEPREDGQRPHGHIRLTEDGMKVVSSLRES
jgi:hypothetical protein